MEFREIVESGDLAVWKTITEKIATNHEIRILKEPETCMMMMQAVDSVGHTPFYAGEVLITEATVCIGDAVGLGAVLEDEPVRALCMAIIDAALQAHVEEEKEIRHVLADEEQHVLTVRQQERSLIAGTKVHFDIMG